MEYEQWLGVLTSMNADNNLNESNVIEKIKEELEKEDPGTYQEWQNNQFDINYTFDNQLTLLHITAINGLAKVTELLIEKGADVDKTGRYGWTPLHYTVEQGFIEIVKVLIEAGANVNAVEESKRTPLHHASCYDHVEIVKVLLCKGADFELKDKGGFTPLGLATHNQCTKVIDALNEFRVISKLSLKLGHGLNQYKNNGDTYSKYNNRSSMENLSPEKVAGFISGSDNVHSMLSMQRKAANYYGSTSSLDCSSIQGVEGLQTNLESNNAPVQRHFQLRERPLYDVNQKIFDSNDCQPNTESSEHESSDRLCSPDYGFFDGSTTRETVQNPQIGLPNNLGIDGVSTQESQSTEENSVLENKKVSQLEQAFAAKSQEAEEVTRDLDVANKKVSQLEQELGSVQVAFATKNQEFEEMKYQLREKTRDLGVANQKVSQLEQAFAAKSQEAEAVKYQSREKTRDLGVPNQKVLQLEQASATKTQELESTQARSEELQKQLESKNKELNGKNKKFLGASTHSKRQGKCVSVSFLLSGAFAVGAILTIPYLAICISLAVAALIFLAVGCYCSYKANTALSNVEVKNGVDSAAMKVLNSPS